MPTDFSAQAGPKHFTRNGYILITASSMLLMMVLLMMRLELYLRYGGQFLLMPLKYILVVVWR